MVYWIRWGKPVRYVVAALAIFTLLRQGWYVNSLHSDTSRPLDPRRAPFSGASSIAAIGAVRQDMYLYLLWTGIPVTNIRPEDLPAYKETVVVADTAVIPAARLQNMEAPIEVSGHRIGIWR